MRVLFLLGCNEGPSKRYRVFNHIESLMANGVHAEWVWDIHEEIRSESYIGSFDIVVAFRSGYNERVEAFFDLTKRLGVPLVYDIDDLVFDPSVVEQIDAYRKMDVAGKADYLGGIMSMSAAMNACQYMTTSTSFLHDYISDFTRKPVYEIPFGVNERQVEIAKSMDRFSDGPRFIGYLSGTKTHQKDFEEAAPALRKILREYDDVYLKLIGYLDVEKHLPGLEHKIVHLDFMDWQDLLIESGSLYVAIAPFEQASLFCQAKSNLKFVETAICGVPTVASAIPSFVDAIDSGVNGFIASTPDEWYDALKLLLDNPVTRERVGDEAYLTAARTYFPKRIGRKLIDVYGDIIARHRSGQVSTSASPMLPVGRRRKSGLRITWIIPQPFEGSGGHRNIFRAIRYLSDFGHSCSVYFLPDNHRFSTGAEVNDFVTREFFDLRADEVVWGTADIDECDVMVCTYWTTAYIVQAQRNKARLHVYFLQDFEPMFFPMGTDYVRAMETYKFGFYPITSGPWPLRMLSVNCGVERGSFFRFPLDRDIYYPARYKAPKTKQRVIYFARPDMPRRCYPLGCDALAIVKQRRPDVEIVFYGDRGEKYGNVPFNFVNLGMTDTINELGDLYRSADVGLCFSTTNPSLVPFEMMACGCPVVDLDLNGNAINYGSPENCMLASANPEDIAEAILRVLDDAALAGRLSANGVAFAEQFPSEIEMVRTIEKYILTEFEHVKNAAYRKKPRVAKAPARRLASPA